MNVVVFLFECVWGYQRRVAGWLVGLEHTFEITVMFFVSRHRPFILLVSIALCRQMVFGNKTKRASLPNETMNERVAASRSLLCCCARQRRLAGAKPTSDAASVLFARPKKRKCSYHLFKWLH